MPSAERIYGFDRLRVLLVLLGILLHSAVSFCTMQRPDLWPYSYYPGNLFFDGLTTAIHVFRVPLFFLLSGYLLEYTRNRENDPWMVKRWKRIGLPFLFGVLVLIPLANAWHHYETTGKLFPDTIARFFVSTNYLWFVWYLLLFHALVLVARRLKLFISFAPIRFFHGWIVLVLALLIFFGNSNGLHGEYSWIPGAFSFPGYFIFFTAGRFMAHGQKESKLNWQLAAGALLLPLCVFLLKLSHGGEELYWMSAVNAVVYAATAWLLSSGIFLLAKTQNERPRPVIAWISAYSYSIYLIHFPLILVTRYWAVQLFSGWSLRFLFILFLTTALSLLIVFLLRKLKLRLP